MTRTDRLAVTAAIMSAALLVAGCGSNPAGSSNSAASSTIGSLRVGTTQLASSVDPVNPNVSQLITQLSLETLLTFGPQGQLEPSLATSWTQASPVTWVYHLRHGVRFWDGHQLTAADVAYSMNAERAPSSADSYAYPTVKTITASGPYAVVVTLTHSDASWQFVPAEVYSEIFEKSFAEAHKGALGNPGVLIEGTGPWKIDSFDPTKGAQLSANPHWWGGHVPIRHISFTFFSSETSEALAFRAGEIDLDPYVVDPHTYAATSGAKLLSTPDCASGLFSMNTLTAPWNDVHVRRAVAYALNRPAIIAAGGGYESPNYTLIPAQLLRTIASSSQVNSLLGSLPLYSYDVARARQEMAESKYPHGFSTTLEEYTGIGQAVNQGQVIAAELQQIGINAQVKSNSLNAWTALATGPASKRPTTLFYSGCTAPDPSNYVVYLGSWNLKQGQYNVADYAPAEIDTLINAGIATTNPAGRFAVYTKLLQKLATDVPYVPLYVTDLSIALSPRFTYSGLSAFSLQNGPYALNIKPTP